MYGRKHVTVAVNHPNELTVFVKGVKFTFLSYPFPTLFRKVLLGGVRAYSVKEIAATKAYTIGRRGSFKDYVDLFFILDEQHASLRSILSSARKKYGPEFNSRLFLEQLLYLDDLEAGGISYLRGGPVTKRRLLNEFSADVHALDILSRG